MANARFQGNHLMSADSLYEENCEQMNRSEMKKLDFWNSMSMLNPERVQYLWTLSTEALLTFGPEDEAKEGKAFCTIIEQFMK